MKLMNEQVMGPHQAYGNIPRSIQYAVEWISDCIQYLHKNNVTRIEPTGKGVQEWTEHVHKISEGFLSNEVASWMTGVNKNVAGRQKPIVARYNGSVSRLSCPGSCSRLLNSLEACVVETDSIL